MSSSLKSTGSTRRWRRIRALVLTRDAFACRFILEDGRACGAYATHVHHIDGRAHGAGDDPARLAAACARHNLEKGPEPGLEAKQPTTAGKHRRPTRWSW